jgi:two-component system phosphate regulon response regulator PhoB
MALGVLVLGDQAGARAAIGSYREQAGCRVAFARDAGEARCAMRGERPGAVLLDWTLPDSSGLAFTRQLRRDARMRHVPLIFVADRNGENERVAALDAGADDYVGAPVCLAELFARVRAVIRRRAPHLAGEPVRLGVLKLDPAVCSATLQGRPLALGSMAFRVMLFFATHPDTVLTRRILMDEIWGDHVFAHDRRVDIYVRMLRGALEPSGHAGALRTLTNVGYCLRSEVLARPRARDD